MSSHGVHHTHRKHHTSKAPHTVRTMSSMARSSVSVRVSGFESIFPISIDSRWQTFAWLAFAHIGRIARQREMRPYHLARLSILSRTALVPIRRLVTTSLTSHRLAIHRPVFAAVPVTHWLRSGSLRKTADRAKSTIESAEYHPTLNEAFRTKR